ncbi:MAG TPA: amidohydrolase family protein [Chloroflexota bacterium]
MMIDTHVHPLSDDAKRYPITPGDPSAPDWYSAMHWTADELLTQMDQAGVDKMVLVSCWSAYAYDNSYCADAVAVNPDRYLGACRIDGLAAEAPDTLSYWVEQRGMHSVRIGSAAPGNYPVCERARELGIPVAIQVHATELGQVRRLAERFSDLKLVLDHLAHPPTEDGPPYTAARDFFALAAVPNLYLKFSTLNLREANGGESTARNFVEALVDRFGPARLMWGSDFPHSLGSPAGPYKDLVEMAHDALAFFSPSDQEQMLAGTARTLYPALGTPSGRG